MSLAAHCVLFISDQDINIQQFEAFGRQFGAIYAQSLGFGGIAPDTEGITVLDAPAFRGKGDGWHVDELWTDCHPPRFAMLRAMEELPSGGRRHRLGQHVRRLRRTVHAHEAVLEPLSAEYTADGVGRGGYRGSSSWAMTSRKRLGSSGREWSRGCAAKDAGDEAGPAYS